MQYIYDHFGVPVKHRMEGMIYFPEYKVWTSDYTKDPYRIEWIYFEKGSILHPLIQTIPHVCFFVDDIEKAIEGKKVLFKPTDIEGQVFAFIEENGIAIEFFQS